MALFLLLVIILLFSAPTSFLFLSVLSTSTSTSLANEVVDPRPSLAACEEVGPMRSRYNVLFLQIFLAFNLEAWAVVG